MSTRIFVGVNRKKQGYGPWADSTQYTLRFEKAGDYGNNAEEIATVRHLTASELGDLRSLIDGMLPRAELRQMETRLPFEATNA